MIGVELEVLAKKFDRFGWERDRGSASHDRMVADWMDALQDYPLDEVQDACRLAVLKAPNKMPNEGHISSLIMEKRRRAAEIFKARLPRQEPERRVPDRSERARSAEYLSRHFPQIVKRTEGGQ